MTNKENEPVEQKQLREALFFPVVMSLLIVIEFVLEKGLGLKWFVYGLQPRALCGLIGIFTMPFLHADFTHFAQNIIPIFILLLVLFYFYKEIALKSFCYVWFFMGLTLWVIGRDSYHIGASGLIYALAFFLFFSGLFRRHIPLIAISSLIVFLYGSMFWGIFPWESHPEYSWEGHLSGAVFGLVFSFIFRKHGPQKPVELDEEEIEDEDPYWLEEPPLSDLEKK
ncbi:MAG: rhomboid family intramembrane serine protease [Bacteroidales bacterium]|jgi:membrane associated rhomboid family serine protease|nr:rhomboid family intramembrane serine protease [Bacteroidales bacterium]